MNISTRPDEQPIAAADAVMAEIDDRYSEGIHKSFSESRMIHILLELKP